MKGGGYVNHFRKKEGDMNLEKTYVCACIWRKEINYLGATRVDGMKLGDGG